eukprot:Gb_13833 [translate_table: standard]
MAHLELTILWRSSLEKPGRLTYLKFENRYARTRTLHRISRLVGGAPPERGISLVNFLRPCGFSNPPTCIHVRLLGPCFKMGWMESPQTNVHAMAKRWVGYIPKQPDSSITPHGATGSRPDGALTLSDAPFQGTWARSTAEDASIDYNLGGVANRFLCWPLPSSFTITRGILHLDDCPTCAEQLSLEFEVIHGDAHQILLVDADRPAHSPCHRATIKRRPNKTRHVVNASRRKARSRSTFVPSYLSATTSSCLSSTCVGCHKGGTTGPNEPEQLNLVLWGFLRILPNHPPCARLTMHCQPRGRGMGDDRSMTFASEGRIKDRPYPLDNRVANPRRIAIRDQRVMVVGRRMGVALAALSG